MPWQPWAVLAKPGASSNIGLYGDLCVHRESSVYYLNE